MAGWLFFASAFVGLGLSLSATLRARRINALTVPYFLAAWLTGELALHHIAWQALATLVFAAFGALSTPQGIAGLAASFVSWGLLFRAHRRAADDGLRLAGAAREQQLEMAPHVDLRALVRPFRMRRTGVVRIADVPYGDSLERDRGRRNLLDVILPAEPGELRPILVQVHGGGWVVGDKEQQAQPLLHHLAERGWACFAPNYRLSPQATFPDHVVDVKRAIAWVREHAADYGADPDFVCITGGSAGGHLCALAALTAGDASLQPGFERADTSVAAAVPFYGVYDLLDRAGVRGRQAMAPFLARHVLKSEPDRDREGWESASPLSRIHEAAPPFLVLHGSHDSLVFVEEARTFVAALREKSKAPVHYLEFDGAQHAFDTFHSVRSQHAVRAVTAFLERTHAAHRAIRA
jgi:acetyl esterase/lipase